jgi:uncharacterized protein
MPTPDKADWIEQMLSAERLRRPVVKEGAVMEERLKARRGFRMMPTAQVQSIASMGGTAAHAKGRAHEFDHDEAVVAGRKGGLASAARRRERDRQA